INYQLIITNGALAFGGDPGSGVGGGVIPLNTWTHVAGTFDGTTYRVYVNGVLVGSAAGTLGGVNTAPLTIGMSGPYGGFSGLVDDAALYRSALSASEIQTIFNAGAGTKLTTGNANGIEFDSNAAGNTVQGNLIGTNAGATAALGNSQDGVYPNHAGLDPTSQITIDAWVKPAFVDRGGSSVDTILMPANGYGYGLFSGASSSWGPLGTLIFNINLNNQIYSSSPIPNDGHFHHVAATYDGANMRIYLDGVQVASQALSGSITYNGNGDDLIGKAYDGRLSQAAIDEVGLYSRA